MAKGSIKLSPKHGANPTMLHCICCGKEYGIGLLGRIKGKEDLEAPKDTYQGLCEECAGVVNQGGVMIIEVKDGETGDNPYRTGRVIGLSKNFKENNHIEHSIMYMHQSQFTELFEDALKNNNSKE